MIESFKNWIEDKGLADPGFKDQGRITIKNKKVYDKYKIPSIPTFSWERGTGLGKKLENKMPGLASQQIKDLATWNAANHVDSSNQMPKARVFGDKVKRIDMKGIPQYRYDTNKIAGTRLDQ